LFTKSKLYPYSEAKHVYAEAAAEEVDPFVDGAIIAAARTLPTWTDKDLPYIPSTEMRSACEIQHECEQLLDAFPTTLEEDIQLLGMFLHPHRWLSYEGYCLAQGSYKCCGYQFFSYNQLVRLLKENQKLDIQCPYHVQGD
jgi:hypothetical protein